MNRHTELIIRVNEQAGTKEFYEKSQGLGKLAVEAFREDGGQERHRAQMTGLENIAETTLKVTDVQDYIKKQTGQQRVQREKEAQGQGWKKKVGPHGELLGQLFIDHIENGLNTFVERACIDFIDSATEQGKREEQKVRLELVRQFIRQLVARYEYEMALPVQQTEQS
jgi:hypothetical protein